MTDRATQPIGSLDEDSRAFLRGLVGSPTDRVEIFGAEVESLLDLIESLEARVDEFGEEVETLRTDLEGFEDVLARHAVPRGSEGLDERLAKGRGYGKALAQIDALLDAANVAWVGPNFGDVVERVRWLVGLWEETRGVEVEVEVGICDRCGRPRSSCNHQREGE